MEKTSNKHLFKYRGKLLYGKKITGMIAANNKIIAKILLRREKIIITNLQLVRNKLFGIRSLISSKDIAMFTRQLATLIKTGIPIVQALYLIQKSQKKISMIAIIASIKKDVEEGLSLAQAFNAFPTYFNTLYCSMINTGEKTGTLENILENLAVYKEKYQKIKNALIKAAFYPCLVISSAIIIMSLILILVVPQFEYLYKNFGGQLPYLTQKTIAASNFLQENWYLTIIMLFIIILIFKKIYANSFRFQFFIQRIFMILPLVSSIWQKTIITRFARTLALTFGAGSSIIECLTFLAPSIRNISYQQAILKIQNQIYNGTALHQALQNTKLFPEIMIQMVAIGEETGELQQMLNRLADYQEMEVESLLNNLSTLIEPILLLILGIIIGILIIAMYLPIFKMGTVF